MSMKYKASFTYQSDVATRHDIPVKIFRVHGGTLRDIDLKSTDDISIFTEMQQAIYEENISLGILPVGEAAIELINLAVFKKPLRVQFVVERYSGRKMLEGLALYKDNTDILDIPYVKNNILFIDLLIHGAKLYRGKLLRNVHHDGGITPTYFEGSEL